MQAGVQMVYVPGGTFAMGSQFAPEEGPIHDVTLSPYYIDQYEVTNAQWAACVLAGGCTEPAVTTAYDGSPYYGETAFDNYPVINVTWYEADTYCRWRGVRLPTEAEWEMAARWNPVTGAVTVYPWGDEWDPLRLNYCDASCLLTANADPSTDDGWPQAAPVGSFPAGASPVGALDMAGNVAEWVADWYGAGYYAISPAENPTGPASGTLRVVRGGAWGVGRDLLRSTVRSRFSPDLFAAGLGLRCAVSADAVNP
jgi:formylglycine-generating enzyme required for sulfatase activity